MEAEREHIKQKREAWLDALQSVNKFTVDPVEPGQGSPQPIQPATTSSVPMLVELGPESLRVLEGIKDALERAILACTTPTQPSAIQHDQAEVATGVNVTQSASVVGPTLNRGNAAPSHHGPTAPPAPASVDMFDFGANNEDYVDPKFRCGVCMGQSDALIALVPCGHYPYCSQCVGNMEEAKKEMPMWRRESDFLNFKLTCPTCQGKVHEFFKVVEVVAS